MFAAALGLPLLLTTPAVAGVAAADPPEVTGAACEPGEGVTVAVDFALDDADTAAGFTVGCAVGEQTTISAAATSAGFELSPASGFVCEIDGVLAEPAGCSVYPGAYWSLLLSTTDGLPGGGNGLEWTAGQVGIDAGPVPVDRAVLFQVQPYVEDWTGPEDDRVPRIALQELVPYLGTGTVDPPIYPPSADPDALAAAGWLGRQLAVAGDVVPNQYDPAFIDWGLTQDAVLGLASAGVGKAQIEATAAKIYAAGEDYIGGAAEIENSWSAIAKTALTLQVAGLDPTAYPAGTDTRNLIADLRSAQNPDGSFGTSDFPFAHALALVTLSRTDGGVPAASVAWLQARQCATAGDTFGAFGFNGCDGVDVDGTALAVQALLAAGVPATDASVVDARNWLIGAQQSDGALPSSFGAPNTNSAALGAQTLLALGDAEAAAAASAAGGFIGSLQVSCATVGANEKVVEAEVGAIGYDAAGWELLLQEGIVDATRDQWTRATAQAVVGLGGPTFDKITAAGAQTDLPAAGQCAPPTTPRRPRRRPRLRRRPRRRQRRRREGPRRAPPPPRRRRRARTRRSRPAPARPPPG